MHRSSRYLVNGPRKKVSFAELNAIFVVAPAEDPSATCNCLQRTIASTIFSKSTMGPSVS